MSEYSCTDRHSTSENSTQFIAAVLSAIEELDPGMYRDLSRLFEQNPCARKHLWETLAPTLFSDKNISLNEDPLVQLRALALFFLLSAEFMKEDPTCPS